MKMLTRQDIEFHCEVDGNFKYPYQLVRGFTYTDYSILPHDHDFYEMNIVLGGSGIHQIERLTFRVKTGDVFVIPPMTVHSYYDTEQLEVYHLLLHKKFIQENQAEAVKVKGYLHLMEIEPFLRSTFSDAMFLHLNPGQLVQLKSDLKFVEDTAIYQGEEYVPLKHHTTWKLLYWLSHLLWKQMAFEAENSANKYEQSILSALEYIHQNYGEKITIESLCNLTFLSRSTFLRNFSEMCGCTPMQYLNEYRRRKALELSENSQMTKTEVAHLCGFYDLSHMERSLKKF